MTDWLNVRIMWLSGISSHGVDDLVSQWHNTIKSPWVHTDTSRHTSWYDPRYCQDVKTLKTNQLALILLSNKPMSLFGSGFFFFLIVHLLIIFSGFMRRISHCHGFQIVAYKSKGPVIPNYFSLRSSERAQNGMTARKLWAGSKFWTFVARPGSLCYVFLFLFKYFLFLCIIFCQF